jgi:hypothetical protein
MLTGANTVARFVSATGGISRRGVFPIPIGFGADAGEQEVDEGTHLGRQVAGGQIHRVDVALDRDIFRKHRLQVSGLQILADDEGGQQAQTEAAEYRLRQRLVVVHMQGAGDRNGDLAVRTSESPLPLIS